MTHMITDQLPLLSCLPAPSYERPYFPSPLPALFSRRYSHKHHHYHQLSCVALRSSSYKPSSHPRLFPSAVSSMTSSDSGPLSEPPPDVAFSSLFVHVFSVITARVCSLKLRSLHLHPHRLCRLAVFLIQNNVLSLSQLCCPEVTVRFVYHVQVLSPGWTEVEIQANVLCLMRSF